MEEDENHGADQQDHAAAKRPFRHIHDSSWVETTKFEPEPDYEQDLDSMTEEQRVRAHLQDVESSFVAPSSPTIKMPSLNAGMDDTYLFDVASKNPPVSAAVPGPAPTSAPTSAPVAAPAASTQPQGESDSQAVQTSSPDQPETNQQSTRESPAAVSTTEPAVPPPASPSPPPAPPAQPAHPENLSLPESEPNSPFRNKINETNSINKVDNDDHGANTTNTTSVLEDLSSPAAAAATRAASRSSAAANATVQKLQGDHDNTEALVQDGPAGEDTTHNISSSTNAHTVDHNNSNITAHRSSVDTGTTVGGSLKVQRPKFLRTRNDSQHSSSSFLTSDEVEGDAPTGLGADYALQSGGAAPAFGLTRSASHDLSRSLSMGSMASNFDDSLDHMRPGPLEPLEEVESPVREQPEEALATPRANPAPLDALTETVIARHVRNVKLPESLTKAYQTKGGSSTPIQSTYKPSDYTPAPNTAARSGRNMTLKEQSNTIERLSKENFNLKLHIAFLSDRLDKLSEEGIKEMISENVELRTSLAVIQRDNKMLRRRVKELEKRYYDDEGRPTTARSGLSSDGRATPTLESSAQANEEEITLLREQIEEYMHEIERLRSDNMASEIEKRKLVESVKAMGDRVSERVGDTLERREEADVWKDLLEQETARREQADDENRRLRNEIFSLKQEMNGSASVSGGNGGPGGMHHTTNIYNITRKHRPASPSRSRPVSGLSGEVDPTSSLSQSSTLVDDLRRESEKLRHENAELRREVGAQTSMLTSRHREKERLYQEIEELKLAQRRSGPPPSTLDSLLDRSASRVGGNDRPISRGSGRSRLTMAQDDPDRDELENKIAEQRDKMNELKFKNQELQRELETCMADFEDAIEGKREAEEHAATIQEELENTTNDLIAIQAERDEALQDQAVWEDKFKDLQEEAQGLVNELEAEADQKIEEVERLQVDLQDRTDNFEALQEEMRNMTDSLIRLEDEQAKTQKIIEQLEQELADSGKELEDLEAQLLESNEKTQRLSVQQESSQGEIAFLREEQEGDKIRIGDLEAALANAEQIITDERERVKELDQRLTNERNQRELIANREKEEVQQIVNDLNREASTAKEEARSLRKSLGNREVEATQWKERLMELENNLREALGDLNGTRSSLLQVRVILTVRVQKPNANTRVVYCHAST